MITASKKRSYGVKDVLEKVYDSNSESDSFEDNDSDRDSDAGLSDHEHVETDDDTSAAEDYGVHDETIDILSDSWETVSDTYVQPQDIAFTAASGINTNFPVDAKPTSIFSQFLTNEVIDLMVTETNRYAKQFLVQSQLKLKSRAHHWMQTNDVEMKKFLGLLLMMGLVNKPCIADYWSTDPVIATPLVNSIMPQDRFELLLKFWHFSDNDACPSGDWLSKLKNICDMLLSRFQSVYFPSKELLIDEPMVLWQGRLMSRKYIPGKRRKYGVKLYLLCDISGYVWNTLIYHGKGDISSGLGHSEAVVMKLMQNRLDCGHKLYVNNFYTSVPLAVELLKHKTLLCGTLRRNRKYLPNNAISSNISKGQCIRRRKGRVMVLKWCDNRDVMMLSTFHSGKMVASGNKNQKGEKVIKPDCVISHNKSMFGVNCRDQTTSYYSPLRTRLRWYRKVVLHFIDMALANAYILYRKKGGNKQQGWFRAEVIRDLLKTGSIDKTAPSPGIYFPLGSPDSLRLQGRHFLEHIPGSAQKPHRTRRCVVCSSQGRRKESSFHCVVCLSKPTLCVVPCHRIYHTEEDFSKF